MVSIIYARYCRSKYGVDVTTGKYKHHPSIRIINENVLFKSRFRFKEIREPDIQKEVSNLHSKKAGTFGNISTKVLKDFPEFSRYSELWDLGKQYFPRKLKIVDITPVYIKKDQTLVENYRPVSVLPCVSKVFERIT